MDFADLRVLSGKADDAQAGALQIRINKPVVAVDGVLYKSEV